MFFDRFRRRQRRTRSTQASVNAFSHAVAAARTTGPDEALVYDVETGELYYLPTRVKRRPGRA
jgi:hypothetical protein